MPSAPFREHLLDIPGPGGSSCMEMRNARSLVLRNLSPREQSDTLTVTQRSQGQSKDPQSPSPTLSLPVLATALEDSARQLVGAWLPTLSAPAWAGPRPPLPPTLRHKWMLDMPLIFVFWASLHLSGWRLCKCLPPGKAKAGLQARWSRGRVSETVEIRPM